MMQSLFLLAPAIVAATPYTNLAPPTATLAPTLSSNRTALFWLVPYENLTSVAAYEQAWHQWKDNYRPGYLMAGSAYAAKPNGSLGYANTAAGEGEHGDLMEKYGFPALKNLGLRRIAMVYVTHYEAISKIVSDPQPFIQQLVDKAPDVGLDGFDIDYEPQSYLSSEEASTVRNSFMDFMAQLSSAMKANGLTLTIDIGECPNFEDFACLDGYALEGLAQVNTMSTFNTRSVSSFKYHESNHDVLKEKWAPGFEPANPGKDAYSEILQYMLQRGVSALATWEVHEANVGDQPQWLFDTVNAFLDGRSLLV